MISVYYSPTCVELQLDCSPLCLSGFTGTENVGTGETGYGDDDFN